MTSLCDLYHIRALHYQKVLVSFGGAGMFSVPYGKPLQGSMQARRKHPKKDLALVAQKALRLFTRSGRMCALPGESQSKANHGDSKVRNRVRQIVCVTAR